MQTNTNHSSREAGALLSFILIGVVLAGLVFGGLYMAKMRGNGAANTGEQTQVAQNDDQKEQVNAPAGAPKEESKDEKPADNNTATQQAGNPQPQQNTATTQREPGRGSGEPQTTTPRAGGQTESAATGAVVPATGTEELMITTLGMTALTYYGVRYLQSRQLRNN